MHPAARSTIKFVDEHAIQFKRPNLGELDSSEQNLPQPSITPAKPESQAPIDTAPERHLVGDSTLLNNILRVQAKKSAGRN
ncbi:hypothetical protein GUITHDRAFT_149929, partial [Guillardia theta CCMP2712]